jgi:excisionase family DNA binding protein
MPTGKHPPMTLPPLYTPSEIATALRCSEWWVKEQARKGRISFTKPGGSYRFTAAHLVEIIRIYEQLPERPLPYREPALPEGPLRTEQTPAAAVHLRARVPRRIRQGAAQQAA